MSAASKILDPETSDGKEIASSRTMQFQMSIV
jgi:hypothetical protein